MSDSTAKNSKARTAPPADFDDDAPVLTEELLARARPAAEVHGAKFAAAMQRAPRGRPKLDEAERKKLVSLRLSPDVLVALRESGAGWQTRVDEILRAVLLPPAAGADDGLTSAFREFISRLAAEHDEVFPGEPEEQTFRDKELGLTLNPGPSLFQRMAALSRDSKSGQYESTDASGTRSPKKRA